MNYTPLTWAVDGAAMQTRSRRGGRVALTGFEFQAGHAVDYLTQLLTCQDGLVEVRYEGAQDIDIMFGDGRQIYIQYKETASTEYTFETMRDILHGFMRDVIDACGNPADCSRLAGLRLAFQFVSTGIIVGEDMLRLVRKSCLPSLSRKLGAGFVYSRNSVRDKSHIRAVAKYVLENLTIHLAPTNRSDNQAELLATARLALFGVPSLKIDTSIAKIKELLTPPRNVFGGDVARCLDGLPDFHPASGRAPVSLIPSVNRFPSKQDSMDEFTSSGRVSWPAIHYQLDVPRDAAAAIRQKIVSLGLASGVILVTGAAGSGKSTVIRRVAWEIHRAGKAMVFEITDPSKLDDDSWNELVRLAELAKKRAVVVIDDIGSHAHIIAEINRTHQSNVIVLASDKNPACLPTPFPAHVSVHNLSTVSSTELGLLSNQLGKKVSVEEQRKLSTFMQHGEIFALSLVMRGSSLRTLAQTTLSRLNHSIPQFQTLFLCVNACGVYDQVVPASLLYRIQPDMQVWTKARSERLVFDETNARMRSGHAKLAAAILDEIKPDVTSLKIQLLEHVNVNNVDERRFGLGLLQNGLAEQLQRLISYSTQLATFASALANVGDYLDLRRCARVLQAVSDAGGTGLDAARKVLLDATGPDRVRTGHDAVTFMNDMSDYAAAFPTVARVYASPSIRFGRSSFMRWVIEHGPGNVDLQREAVRLHVKWLAANDFPAPETLALVNCINYGNPSLPTDVYEEFKDVLQLVLKEISFSPSNLAYLDILHAAAETICSRIRVERLFRTLLDNVENNFTTADLSHNPKLLRYLMASARLAGNDADREAALKLIAPALPEVTSKELRGVIKSMTSVVPRHLKRFVVEWSKRFAGISETDAPTLARDFLADLGRQSAP